VRRSPSMTGDPAGPAMLDATNPRPNPPAPARTSRGLAIVALLVGVAALALSAYTIVALAQHQLPPQPAEQSVFSGTIFSQPVAYTGGTFQQAVQSVTIGGTQSTNALNSHVLSLAVTLSYPCPYYTGQSTGILAASNCFVALVQGQAILESTLAFIPANQTILDYNLLVPSGPFNLVVAVGPDYSSFQARTAGAFNAVIVLDDLGQTATT
jgi:hypothetical protein